MNTLDIIPGLNGHDSLPNIRAIHEAAKEADAIAAEDRARREHLMEQLQAEIDRGDAYVSVFFAGRKSVMVDGFRVDMYPNLGDVLYEALDIGDGGHEFIQYVLDRASEGDEKAQALLESRAKAWVEGQL
jgi:hypothetical protein